jgi:hypothetical protein
MTKEKENDDPLLQALRALPTHAVTGPPGSRAREEARRAFVEAFDDRPFLLRFFGSAGRAAVPVVLASVVGLYLFWAFAVAIMINQ